MKDATLNLDLANKTALVTGSSRGTGLIIAKRLAEEGARVLVHGMADGLAQQAVADLGLGEAVTGDLTCDAGAQQLAEECTRLGVNIDILVNNYGTADASNWSDSLAPTWIEAYQKNVLSAQRAIGICLAGMRQRRWGRIINLGTVGSTRPNARNPAYYAAKGALATLTVSLAKEVGAEGIRVNLVSPGLIRTPEVEAAFLARGRRKGWGETWAQVEPHVAKDIPIGRIVTREEVADLTTFLASPLADGIHGQNIRVDGGSLDIVT